MDIKQIRERIKTVKKAESAIVSLVKRNKHTEGDGVRLKQLRVERERLEAIERGEHDVAFFAYRYFSDEYNAGNKAGNIIRNDDVGTSHETIDEIAPIHRDFYDICDDITTKRKGNYVVASPRGHAKTAILSTVLAIHEIVYGKRRYILMLSETDTLSKKIVASIASQLKYNDKLRTDFGELLHVNANRNVRDNEDGFQTSSNTLVEATSAGKSLRGRTFNNYRPDLVLLDDVSSLNNENTEQARAKLIDWFNSVVQPLPSKDAAIVFVGTKVTATGLLAHLLGRRDYKQLFHAAIISEPRNPQLWQDYLHLYQTEADDTKLDEYYYDNENDLLDGVELAWPNRWTYRELMHVKSNIGSRSFASEYMNESFASDEQLFDVESYAYGRRVFDQRNNAAVEYNGKYYRLNDMDITGAWDVAMAGTKRSALNAFVTIGRHRDTGLVFVLDTYATREVPSVFMGCIIERIIEYKHGKVVVEGIGAYSEFYSQLLELTRHHNLYHTKIELLKSHGRASKSSRIESLEPPLANKSLILNAGHTELLQELRQYPLGLVDVIDALQIVFKAGGIRRTAKLQEKPMWM